MLLNTLFFLCSFVADNIENFQTCSGIHNANIRHDNVLHVPNANFISYYKYVGYSWTKIHNFLPDNIKILTHDQVFKPAQKDYLLGHTYFVEFTQLADHMLCHLLIKFWSVQYILICTYYITFQSRHILHPSTTKEPWNVNWC